MNLKHSKLAKRLTAFVIIVILILLGGFIWLHKSDQYQIPKNIKQQLDFPVLFLKNPAYYYQLNKSSIKYSTQSDGSKVFSFIIQNQSNHITFSEQAYPEILIYDKFTNSLNPYSEIGTLYGTVTLGRPKDAAGHQVAGFKYTDSTLIFAQPQQSLSDSQWRQIINTLEPIK